jgi:hypothetical protein
MQSKTIFTIVCTAISMVILATLLYFAKQTWSGYQSDLEQIYFNGAILEQNGYVIGAKGTQLKFLNELKGYECKPVATTNK